MNRKPWSLISTTHSGKPVGGYSTRRRIHCQHSLSNVALNIFERRLPAILVRCQVSKFLRGSRSYPTQSHRTMTPFLHTKRWHRRSGGRGHRHPDRFSISSRSSCCSKRCPILRTVLHRIIVECWSRKQIPECWKRGATVLIYKKNDTGDPANFRPITLQSSWYKIMSTVMKNRIYDFLVQNNYIDRKIQKGFWPKVDGVSEHTELLTHIVTDAKRHSRNIVGRIGDRNINPIN